MAVKRADAPGHAQPVSDLVNPVPGLDCEYRPVPLLDLRQLPQCQSWRVFLHDDQTAELADNRGRVCLGRVPLHRVGRHLAELGYDVTDLVRE